MFTHVYRALDETLFAVDRSKRFPASGSPTASSTSTVAPADLGWGSVQNPDQSRFNAAAGAIANLMPTSGYGGLTPDALRLLASLPSNAEAFTCLTAKALDPETPDQKRASDDPQYPDSGNPNLSSYEDTLDGRATNVYFYRTAKVNRANTAGKLGVSTPPMILPPSFIALAAPTIIEITGLERAISLRWIVAGDSTATSFRVYRADDPTLAAELRTMSVVGTPDRSGSGIETAFIDTPAPALRTLYYRITAVPASGQESLPTDVVSGRASRSFAPLPPASVVATRVTAPATGVRLTWTMEEPLAITIQRREAAGDPIWTTVALWFPAGTLTFDDLTAQPDVAYLYRLRGRDEAGILSALTEPVAAPV
jgi:hypothetical protein